MSLAQRVRDYRYSKGWGPDELANRAAISRTALYQIESGKTELPRAGTLRRIAMALDVSMETLLGHMDAAAGAPALPSMAAGPATSAPKTRAVSEWLTTEGVPLSNGGSNGGVRSETSDVSRFGVEHAATHELLSNSRERDLVLKFHDLLVSPIGESVAKLVEESHRLLPRMARAGGFD